MTPEMEKPEGNEVEVRDGGKGREDGKKELRGIRVTERDEHLLGTLATARVLSTDQVRRLFYPDQSETTARLRLEGLAGNAGRELRANLVRKETYRSHEGKRLVMWGLTEAGYRLAQKVLKHQVPVLAHSVGPEFLDHEKLLVEFLVRMNTPRTPGCYALANQPWQWRPSPKLPCRYWRGRNLHQQINGMLEPDAVLLMPVRGAFPAQRIFIEYETGKVNIDNAEKPGSVANKVNRYRHFCPRTPLAQLKTQYAETFSDGVQPIVWFVSTTKKHAAAIHQYLARVPDLLACSLTLEDIVTSDWFKRLPPLLTAQAPKVVKRGREPGRRFAPPEIKVLRSALQEAYEIIHEVRQGVRRAPLTREPLYPHHYNQAAKLLELDTLTPEVLAPEQKPVPAPKAPDASPARVLREAPRQQPSPAPNPADRRAGPGAPAADPLPKPEADPFAVRVRFPLPHERKAAK